jgi:hypothetical protein
MRNAHCLGWCFATGNKPSSIAGFEAKCAMACCLDLLLEPVVLRAEYSFTICASPVKSDSSEAPTDSSIASYAKVALHLVTE